MCHEKAIRAFFSGYRTRFILSALAHSMKLGQDAGELWVAGGDVAGHALAEPEAAEEPERRRQALLAAQLSWPRIVEVGRSE